MDVVRGHFRHRPVGDGAGVVLEGVFPLLDMLGVAPPRLVLRAALVQGDVVGGALPEGLLGSLLLLGYRIAASLDGLAKLNGLGARFRQADGRVGTEPHFAALAATDTPHEQPGLRACRGDVEIEAAAVAMPTGSLFGPDAGVGQLVDAARHVIHPHYFPHLEVGIVAHMLAHV